MKTILTKIIFILIILITIIAVILSFTEYCIFASLYGIISYPLGVWFIIRYIKESKQ